MYTPSYPTNSKLVPVSKENPCPHCGKPDWCYSIGELSVCNRENPPAEEWTATTKTDGEGKFYYAPIQEKKTIRPRQTRYWEYPARDGSPLVRAVRFDDGKGGKPEWHQEKWNKSKSERKNGWVVGTEGVAREDIPVYRYAEVKRAIANNELIYLVEGESCADILWELGLAATCNIGGSSKWRISDTSDLKGAKVVIVPDRDEPGIKHAELLHQEFPDALWLYPYPNSKAWENLPKSQGLDLADWIEQHQITAEDIKAAIGEKKVFKASPQATAKVVRPEQFQIPHISELGGEIEKLLESDLKKSQLRSKITELAQKFRLNTADVWGIYRDREQELEQESDQEDTAFEVARLLSAQKSGLELAEILPPGLAAPIKELATRLNLKPECYLAAGLTQVSSLFKVGSEVLLRRDTDYRCTPNYFAGIVAESSQKKSPIMRAMIERPMKVLRDKARTEYQKAVTDYEAEYKQWKTAKGEDKGLPPKEPRQRLYSFSKSTGEGILYQVAEFPDQALMYRCDELAGLFKSANQYRGGKGSDDEDLLEFWNGTGSTVLRASGVKADLEGLLLSVFGTIQPDVLAELLKDCSDSNGKFARFDFVFQPLAASKLSEEDSGSFDITPMLADVYTKIDKLPAMKFELSPEAKRLFTAFYNATEERRVDEPKQGIRAMVGKMPEKVGKMAAIIHAINCVFNGVEVSTLIPKGAVEAAIKFVKFSADQIASLYAEFSDPKALAPSLAKLALLAERKGGTLSVREAQHAFHIKQRPSAQQIREFFGELESMNFGVVTTVKKTVSFCLTTTTVTTVTSNPCAASVKDDHSNLIPSTTVTTVNATTVVNRGTTVVTNVPQSEPLHSKDLKPTVVTVVPNYPLSEKAENSLLSSEPSLSLKSAAIPKGHRTFKVGDQVVAKDVGGIYQGARGKVVDIFYGSTSQTYLVRFDKPVRNVQQSEFEGFDLMKL
ncbi:MAG: DUF3987 domain-containing protein [Microcoleus sp. PH2017_40_RAT_O_B]|uniref:DUF3987 domain-containing protein n=1 Tax=unclassified Microcoleus TaxID=2642155 RepID=UPI001E159439|nr:MULTISPECIES: DUF3987 domain-containing protein [unclassified Microcoleus]MCC3573739.1 DUF3987 domain-containing protein [Microcoleus sp. PH2017_34_RAT_O_A]MCC3611185.1 DUF3987 domain-containing protein [Microcoleus sp. PH2017_40_RAT_O_B]